ncbi:MAG: type II secretion system GspH family protein [Firmicutes bacterium]|nr:type II secretion system GspH family protein [Bacillota bacterium]
MKLRSKSNKGVTLIEALISMAILGLLLVVVYKAFVPSMDHFRKVNDQTKTEQSALVAYQRLFADLTLSNPSTVTITDSPTKSLSFLSFSEPVYTGNTYTVTNADLLGYDDETNKTGTQKYTNEITWKKFVIIYPGTTMAGSLRVPVLLKKEVVYNLDHEVHRLTSTAVQRIINDSACPAYVLSRDVATINFTMPSYPAVTIEVIAFEETRYKKSESSRYIFVVKPRN